ncbi:MAG: hypothetical protein BWY78_00035 [Alphaproteobacteria bacterium ADurb.Bin438]|nr:MAG: hypothetical protein BWY78_00035 [Alphaproteobacteria bacterium ADurb.Bin438]
MKVTEEFKNNIKINLDEIFKNMPRKLKYAQHKLKRTPNKLENELDTLSEKMEMFFAKEKKNIRFFSIIFICIISSITTIRIDAASGGVIAFILFSGFILSNLDYFSKKFKDSNEKMIAKRLKQNKDK